MRRKLKSVVLPTVGLAGTVPVDLLTGLVAAYRFDSTLDDSGSGGKTLADESGGNLSYATGVLGNAVVGGLGGPSIATRTQDLLSGSIANGDWTVCGWFKCTAFGTAYLELNDVADVPQVAVGVQDQGGALKAYAAVAGATGSPFRNTSVPSNTYRHVAFVATGGSGSLYVNASLVGSAHALAGAGTFDATGEAEVYAEGGFGTGGADTVLVYSVALSVAQIAALYNAGSGFDPTA